MERTRIVYYTHSKTPVILSPSSHEFPAKPPRLSSSSSLSSLASISITDQAPIAFIETENPSTPRRSSKSGDQCSIRSSSTGRLKDEAYKLHTSIYTAIRCQDYPVSPRSTTRRAKNGVGATKERPRSAYYAPDSPVSRKSSKASADDFNGYHTLDSWSRSRRQQTKENLNGEYERNTRTLPLKRSTTINSPSSDTLVKSRRRYTWLSSKATSPQTPILKTPPQFRQHDVTEETKCRQREVTEETNCRLDVTKETNPYPNIPLTPDLGSGSPTSDGRPESGGYNWKNDPRRRPCNFVDVLDIDPLDTPSTEHKPGAKDLLDQNFMKDSGSFDTGYSSPDMVSKQPKSTVTPPQTLKIQSGPKNSLKSPQDNFEFGKCNNGSYHHFKSPTHSCLGHFIGQDDSMNDRVCGKTDDTVSCESLSNHPNERDYLYSPPVVNIKSKSNDGETTRACERITNRELSLKDQHRGDDVSCDSTGVGIDKNERKLNTQINGINNIHGHHSDSFSKRSSAFSGDSPKDFIDIDYRNEYSSPRTRNSFRMALENSLKEFPPISEKISPVLESPILSPKRSGKVVSPKISCGNARRRQSSKDDDDVFVSDDLVVSPKHNMKSPQRIVSEYNSRLSEKYGSNSSNSSIKQSIDSFNPVVNQNEGDCYSDDSLNRRIKRDSLKLATANISDITCAIDVLDIKTQESSTKGTNKKVLDDKSSRNGSPSPFRMKPKLSRTGSCLSSQNSSSFGSFYSCQSGGSVSNKNSPSSTDSHRSEIRARFDSPNNNRLNRYSDFLSVNQSPWDGTFPRSSSTRTSSPSSTTSSSRSSHSHHPKMVYYWTRQSPYPRRSCSVASSKGSTDRHRKSSITSSIHSNSASHNDSHNRFRHNSNISVESSRIFGNKKSDQSETSSKFCNVSQNRIGKEDSNFETSYHTLPSGSSHPVDRRSLTLPLSSHLHSSSSHTDTNFDYFTSDISPTSSTELESPNAVRSPPSLGRPRRKQYAGFDSQPLPMESFMSDSSSIYTCMSCSSRATDMTGQPDNCQFDESFVSDDVGSVFEDDSRGDISFDASETLRSDPTLNDTSKEIEESESKCGSVHSNSTTKHGNGDISTEETSREDSSIHNVSYDDFIENSNNHILSLKINKQFGSEYDALFRLYKSDDLTGEDMFTSPSYPRFLQNGKAFSSSCLLRSSLYSKQRKFLSSRDIFDLFRNSDKTPLDGTVSLTSLEKHANKVCEAILCYNEMEQGLIKNQRHSLV